MVCPVEMFTLIIFGNLKRFPTTSATSATRSRSSTTTSTARGPAPPRAPEESGARPIISGGAEEREALSRLPPPAQRMEGGDDGEVPHSELQKQVAQLTTSPMSYASQMCHVSHPSHASHHMHHITCITCITCISCITSHASLTLQVVQLKVQLAHAQVLRPLFDDAAIWTQLARRWGDDDSMAGAASLTLEVGIPPPSGYGR